LAEYPNFPIIEKIGLQGDALNVAACIDNNHISEDLKLFDDCLHKDDEIIGERLKTFSSLLKQLEY